jgi:chromosome segregation ATPase
MGRGGLRELQRRMSEQALAHSDAERARDAAMRDNGLLREAVAQLEQQLRELSAALAQLTGREGELRRGLIEAHDQLLRRDAELDEARRDVTGLRAEVARLEEIGRGDRAWSAEQARRSSTSSASSTRCAPGRRSAGSSAVACASPGPCRRARDHRGRTPGSAAPTAAW